VSECSTNLCNDAARFWFGLSLPTVTVYLENSGRVSNEIVIETWKNNIFRYAKTYVINAKIESNLLFAVDRKSKITRNKKLTFTIYNKKNNLYNIIKKNFILQYQRQCYIASKFNAKMAV